MQDTGLIKKKLHVGMYLFLGTITNTSALPVTKMYFGGLEYEIQSGSFLLGRLKCYGKIIKSQITVWVGHVCPHNFVLP